MAIEDWGYRWLKRYMDAPAWVKEPLGRLYGLLPDRLRHGKDYPRYRAEAAPGDPRLHYASGFLHLIHPDFRDLEAAAADLARLQEHAAGDASAARAAELLAAGLAQARDSGGN